MERKHEVEETCSIICGEGVNLKEYADKNLVFRYKNAEYNPNIRTNNERVEKMSKNILEYTKHGKSGLRS
jgi:hypothetical protein